jgi:hypothetical protein
MNIFQKKVSGMSLVELLIGAGVFVMIMAISASSGIMIYKGKAKIQYTNELYTETRFLMERIIRDVRINTIDYGEYFSQNLPYYSDNGGLSTPTQYGDHPGKYEMFFQFIPDPSIEENNVSHSNFSWSPEYRDQDVNIGIFNTGADDDPDDEEGDYTLLSHEYSSILGSVPSQGLYLLSADGMTKTLFQYISEEIDGEEQGRIEMKKMELVQKAADCENTGTQYRWCPIHEFTSITPPSINVTNFTFFLSPKDDPHKAFAKADKDGVTVHIQPHVIVRITARLVAKNANAMLGENNEFSLQTAAASRVFHNVTFPRD